MGPNLSFDISTTNFTMNNLSNKLYGPGERGVSRLMFIDLRWNNSCRDRYTAPCGSVSSPSRFSGKLSAAQMPSRNTDGNA